MWRFRLIVRYVFCFFTVPGFVFLALIIGLIIPFSFSWVASLFLWMSDGSSYYLLSPVLTLSAWLRGLILSGPFYLVAIKVWMFGILVIVMFILLLDLLFPSFFNSKILEMMYSDYMMEKLRGDDERVKKVRRKIAEAQIRFSRRAEM